MKAFPTEALTHAPISAVLDIVRQQDLAPEQVEKVRIRSLHRAADILADPSKYDPRSKETADHSLPYVVAAAIVDRNVTPAQFTDEKIGDERVRAQLSKVVVEADEEIEALFPKLQRVKVAITTTDGQTFEEQLDYPKGDPRNPLSDEEIEAKFDALAEPVMSDTSRARLKDSIWNLDEFGSVREWMRLTRSDRS
jgi:2-methylcitrate dehydratase